MCFPWFWKRPNKAVLLFTVLICYWYVMSTMFHLLSPHSNCSRCYGNSRSSCSSCIDKWRPWQYPCCGVAVGLAVGWEAIGPCLVHSHPQPPPLLFCLRSPWPWPHRIAAANHASPLVSQWYLPLRMPAQGFKRWPYCVKKTCFVGGRLGKPLLHGVPTSISNFSVMLLITNYI